MKIIPSLLLAFCIGTGLQASDYLSGRAEALKAMQEGNFAQAAERFKQLAEGTANQWQKADALSHEVACLQKLDRSAEAMELALKITPRPASILSQMTLLKEGRQWKEILALSETEAFDQWPEKFIFEAYMIRGDAYRANADLAKAEADYSSARRFTVSPAQDGRAALALGELYAETEPAKALEVYGEICQAGPGTSLAVRAHIARARLFSQSGEWENARAEVAALDQNRLKDPYWICTAQLVLGEIYEKEGKPKEALESYRKAAAVEKAPANLLGQASAKVAALETSG